LFDRTNGSSPGFSERLNGTTNEKYGLARSIAVSSGDVVSAEVYAKYPDTNSANWLPALSTLMGNIATNTGNIVVDGSNYANGNNPFNALFAQAHTPSGTAPQAYLNCVPAEASAKAGMVFDKNWNLISSKSGYMQITTAGRETGSDVAHERLFTPSISITEPGYVYIYVSNEDLAAPKDVFFDDFSVTQVKTPIVQTEDYYPFGLTFNAYQRDSSMPDQYLYNGKELQDELSLGWLDYGARMYMPELGRWGVVDRMMELYPGTTNYGYVGNNPLIFIDPTGETLMVNFVGGGSDKKFINEIEKMFNGQFKLKFSQVTDGKGNQIKGKYQVGIIATKGGGDRTKLSEGAKSFYDGIKQVIDDPKVKVDISIYNGDEDLKNSVGNYLNNKIDMADIEQFPEFNHQSSSQSGPTRGGKLIHEIREQFFKAMKGEVQGEDKFETPAHDNGIHWEETINQNSRLHDTGNFRTGVIQTYKLKNGTVVRYKILGWYGQKVIQVNKVK
jgi:RHS repeat-associated protein